MTCCVEKCEHYTQGISTLRRDVMTFKTLQMAQQNLKCYCFTYKPIYLDNHAINGFNLTLLRNNVEKKCVSALICYTLY